MDKFRSNIIDMVDKYGESSIYDAVYDPLGYTEPVPTIDEFIESDEYLGMITNQGNNIYRYWRDVFRDVYPTPFSTKYHSILLRGSIGTGKSVTSKIMTLYNLMKILKLKDPRTKFNMLPTTVFTLFCYGATLDLVHNVVMRELLDWINQSPFFKSKLNMTRGGSNNCIFNDRVTITAGTTVTHNVGLAVPVALFDEIQREVRHDQLRENYYSVLQRIQSRFRTDEGLFGQIVMVGSAGGANDFCEILTEKSREDKEILILNPPQWKVLAHGPNGKGGKLNYSKDTFKLFIGDDSKDPFIIDNSYDEKYLKMLNQDLIYDVPMDYYKNFTDDIMQAIRDIAGVTTRSQFRFFQSMAKVKPSFNKMNWFDQDIIKVSFYDHNDKIIDKINKNTFSRRLNKDLPRFIHIDIGYSNDNTGITMLHISGTKRIQRSNILNNTTNTIKEPKYTVDFSVGISRYSGEE